MNNKLIDISGLKKIAGGDDAFVIEILTLFSERTQKDLEELAEAEKEENWDSIQFLVHRMRSAAVPLGIKDLLVYLKKIELNLKQGILDDIHGLLKSVYKLAATAVEEALHELKATSV